MTMGPQRKQKFLKETFMNDKSTKNNQDKLEMRTNSKWKMTSKLKMTLKINIEKCRAAEGGAECVQCASSGFIFIF